MPSRKLYLRLWHPAKRKRGFLILPDGNVLPSHLHTAASVDLQTDDAICEFGRGVRKVHNLCAIELRNDVSAVHGHFQLIPVARLQRVLAFWRGLRHPATPAAFVQTARVLAHVRVDLHLHPFDVRAMLRVDTRNLGMNEYAAVARGLAFEFEAQHEIPISLFRGQVSILVGGAFAEDSSLLNDPLFLTILLPAAQVFSIEESNPAAFMRSLSQGAQPEEERYGKYPTTSFHDKSSASA